jgi:hypothetical protein
MGSRRTVIVNETRVTRTSISVAPKQPPQQPVVQSGKISGSPTVYRIGAVAQISPAPDLPLQTQYNPFRNAWNTIPYVPYRPRNVYNPPVQPFVPRQAIANTNLTSVGTIKDEVCEDILQNPVRSVDNFNITGNGSAVRFRFPVSGAPSEVAVTNNNTGAALSSSDFTVLIRGEGVSWIIFNTAPANGVSYNIKYIIGDNPFLRNVKAGDWTGWLLKLNDLQRQLETAKINGRNGQPYNYGYSTTQNRIPEAGQYDVAIEAVIELKRTIQKPGVKLDLRTVATACNNLDDQLLKINAGTGKNSQADATIGAPLVVTPSITRPANIIFEFDQRYDQFKKSSDCSGFVQGGDGRTIYQRQYDNQVRSNYFDLNSGKYCPPPPPVYNPGVRSSDDRDSNENWGGSSSLAPTTSPRPEPRPSQKNTTPNTNSGGRAPSSSPRPEPRGGNDYGSGRNTKDDAYGGSAFV